MKQKISQNSRGLLLALMCLLYAIGIEAQTWTAPALKGSVPVSGNTYYVFNVGSNGYLNQGGYWKTQAVVSSFPYANGTTTLIKWTATNTSGSLWTFQLNSAGTNQAGKFLYPANTSSADGSVYTDNSTNNTWNILQTDASNNIYSIQVVGTYGGYVLTQYLGTELAPEVANATSGNGASGTFNAVRYNRSASTYTQWKFVSQADLDLYNAKVVLNRYMKYAKAGGSIDLSSYISTYNAGVTADITTAAGNLLTALGRTTVAITNGSFESATGVNTTIAAWTNGGTFQNQNNVPGTGWTKDGNYYCEKFTASSYGTNGKGAKGYLSAAAITQTITVPNGLYGLMVSGHAVQQAGANPLHSGAFFTAASLVTEVTSGSDYYIDSISVTNGSLNVGYSLTGTIQVNWTGFDNFRLYRYVTYSTPSVSASVSSLSFDNVYPNASFTILGANLTSDITISGVPTGITLSGTNVVDMGSGIYKILVANVNATNTISVSYDGTSQVNLSTVSISANGNGGSSASSSFTMKAIPNSSCFTALYSDKTNLITDPYMNSLTNYGASWGVGSGFKQDSIVVYCGKFSGKITGQRAGSLTYSLSSIWKPNTKYRLKAKVYTPDAGRFDLWVSGWSGSSADIGASLSSSALSYTSGVTGTGAGSIASGQWNDVDFTFTTGTLSAASQYFYFNNFANNVSGTSYIDNIELYEIERYVSSSANLSAITSANTTNAEVVVNAGTELTIDANSTVKKVTVNPLGKMTVSAEKVLTASNLVISSDATGTATFVNNGTYTVTAAIVNQYLTSGRNWYVSSPVSASTTTALSSATSVARYDEPTHAFVTLNAGDALIPGVGYISVTGSTGAVTFSGTLNDGDKTLALTRTDGTKAGFNLIGNPYPSYLDWKAAYVDAENATNANVGPTIWYRTKTNADAYTFGTYNASSNLGTSINTGDVATGNIPPMQAFWVRVNAGQNSGTLKFKNSMRKHKGTQLQDDAVTYTDGPLRARSVAQQVLRLQVSNGLNDDEAIIAFNGNASNGLDEYDSYKMSNANAAIPEIYTTVGTENLVINGLNSVESVHELPLGFTTGQSNTFSIRASQVSNFDGYNIYLRDNVLNTETDLTNGGEYTFTSDATSSNSRFTVVFRSASASTGLGKATLANVHVFGEKGSIMINSSEGFSGKDDVSIYNVGGQKLTYAQLVRSTTVLNSNFTPGVYVVILNVNGEKRTERVIVK